MGKHPIEWTSQEWNSFLIEKYNLGLNTFATFIRATLFYNPKGAMTVSKLIDMRAKLVNLENRIISVIEDYESLWRTEYTWEKSNVKSKEDVLDAIKTYKAEGIFEYIDESLDIIDSRLEAKKNVNKKKGSPIKCQNIIVTYWGLLIEAAKKKFEWEILTDLLEWFWEKLKSYKLYKRINPGDKILDPEYLRNQFYRNKEKLSELFFLIMNWHFSGRIPWKGARLTVIFGEKFHFYISHFELHKKGLSCFANPKKLLLYEAIIEKISGIIRKKIAIAEYLKKEVNSSNISLIDIQKAHYYYAFRLYRANPNSPPLIIFPDLTYL